MVDFTGLATTTGTRMAPDLPAWMAAPAITEQVISTTTVFRGRIFNLESLNVRFPDGNTGLRDVIRHPGATAVLAINDRDEVLLTNQWRTALGRVSTEIPAGTLEPGEDPATCAARELEEETGLTASSLTPLTSIATCAGFCDEVLHIYQATGLAESDGRHQQDEDEFIEVVWVPFDEVLTACLDGSIADSKTLVAVLAVAAVRTRREG